MNSRRWEYALLALCGAATVAGPASPVHAQSGWQAEFGLTLPYNFPAPLRITQSGQPDLEFTAHYVSEPFTPPVTWQLRVARWRDHRAWALEFVHHKVYLENGPAEVQAFSVSHGFNLLTVQRAWRREHFQWRLGAGVVLTHPESTVRGKTLAETGGPFGGGYHLSGPTLGVAVARPVPLTHGLFVNCEAKLAFSYASVDVVDGDAGMYSVFVQLAILLGYGPDGKVHP